MTVSTNGRSTPLNTGGSWRSLMMPTGISIMPARMLNAARQQEVDVRLLELELAGLLEPLDERVLELELADESDAVRKPWLKSRTKRWKSSTPSSPRPC